MNGNVEFRYLQIPAVIRGHHAELIALNGGRLCGHRVQLARIGVIPRKIMKEKLWQAWSELVGEWKSRRKQVLKIISNDWLRKVVLWVGYCSSRPSRQPEYKNKRPRFLVPMYSGWDHACRMMMRQIHSRRFYRGLNSWGRWACFAVGNSRKRKEKNEHR